MPSKKSLCQSICLVLAGLSAVAFANNSQLLGYRAYNSAGDMLSISNGSGDAGFRDYHVDGSLLSSTNLLGSVQSHHYNGLGQLSSLSVKAPSVKISGMGLSSVDPSLYTYEPGTKRLLSKQVSNSDSSPAHYQSKVDYVYTVGGKIKVSTQTFKVKNNLKDQSETKTVNYTSYESYAPSSGKVNEAWDSLGNVEIYTYGDYGITSIRYYKVSEKTGLTPPKISQTKLSNPNFEVTYTYDDFGRVKEIQRTPGYTTYNFYDGSGRLSGILFGSGSYADMELLYQEMKAGTYTPSKELKRSSDRVGGRRDSSSSGFKLGYLYTYSLSNNPLTTTIFSNTDKAQGSIEYHYTYNRQNQLTAFNAEPVKGQPIDPNLYPTDSLGTPFKERQYTYGLNNNLKTVTTTGAIKNKKSSSYPQITLTYHYYTNKGYPNQLKSITVNTKASDSSYPHYTALSSFYNDDNLYQYNHPSGLLLSDPEGTTYRYNVNSRLIERLTANQSKQIYRYGPNGLLDYQVSKLMKPGNGSSDSTGWDQNGRAVYSFYGHKGLQGQQQGTGTDQTNSYYLNGLGTITEQPNKSASKDNPTTQTLTGLYEVNQGHVAMTTRSEFNTDDEISNFSIDNQYIYSPYGQQNNLYHPTTTTTKTGETYTSLVNQTLRPLDINKNQFGYTGQQRDPSSNMMTLGGFRNYAPAIGRFTQPDSYNTFSKKSVNNPYAYVRANPLAYTDPNGHDIWGWMADVAEDSLKETLLDPVEEGEKMLAHPAETLKSEYMDIQYDSTHLKQVGEDMGSEVDGLAHGSASSFADAISNVATGGEGEEADGIESLEEAAVTGGDREVNISISDSINTNFEEHVPWGGKA